MMPQTPTRSAFARRSSRLLALTAALFATSLADAQLPIEPGNGGGGFGFLEEFGEAVEELGEALLPQRDQEERQDRSDPIERPLVRDPESVDPVEALLGPRRSPDHETLSRAAALLQVQATESEIAVARRGLQRVMDEPNDRFVWTNRERWTSTRRLARSYLHRLPEPARGRNLTAASYRNASLEAIAVQSLRHESAAVSQRLRKSWDAVRRDAGARLVGTDPGAERASFANQAGSPRNATPSVTMPHSDKAPLSPKPVATAAWAITDGTPEWADKLSELADLRRVERESLIPANQATMTNDLCIWRTPDGLEAVRLLDGRRSWSIRLPDADRSLVIKNLRRAAAGSPGGSLWQQGSGQGSLEHLVYGGGARTRPIADEQRAYVVIDVNAYSSRLRDRQFRFRAAQSAETDPSYGTSLLRAIDIKDGHTVWEIGGESLRDSFDRPLAGVFLLGAPTIVGDTLYVLGEIAGEVALFVIDSATGRERWRHPLCAVDFPIAESPTRRFWSLSPAVLDGRAVCPTGVGWIVGVDVDGRELLWATRVVPERQRTPRFSSQQLDSVDDAWHPARPIVAGNDVWLFPPESGGAAGFRGLQRAVVLSLESGEIRAQIRRKDGDVPVGVIQSGQTSDVIIVGRSSLVRMSIPKAGASHTGTERWRCEVGAGRHLTGRPVVGDEFVYAPVDGRELWVVRLTDGTVVSRQQYSGAGALGNLAMARERIISTAADSLVSLRTESDPLPRDLLARFYDARTRNDGPAARSAIAAVVDESDGLSDSDVRSQFLLAAISVLSSSSDVSSREHDELLNRLADVCVTNSDRLLISQSRVEVALQRNEPIEALRRLITMSREPQLDSVAVHLMEGRPAAVVGTLRLDLWVEAVFQDAYQSLNAAQRAIIDNEIRDVLQSGSSRKSLLPLSACPLVTAFLEGTMRRSEPVGEEDLRDAARLLASQTTGNDTTQNGSRERLFDELLVRSGTEFRWKRGREFARVWNNPVGVELSGIGVNRGVPSVVPILTDDRENLLADVRLVHNKALRSIEVRSLADGRLLASLPLSRKARRAFDGQPFAWVNLDQLLIAASGTLHAFSVVDWREQWNAPLSPNLPFTRQPTESAFFFGRFRDLSIGSYGEARAVVAITPSVIVVESGSRYRAIDRRDGRTCWSRQRPDQALLLGNTDHSIVMHDRNDWLAIDVLSGELTSLQVPAVPGDCIAVTRRGIVTIDPEGFSGPVRVLGFALPQHGTATVGEPDWEQTWPNNAIVALVGRAGLIVQQSPGDGFTLVDLESGASSTTPPIPGLSNTQHGSQALAGFYDSEAVYVVSDQRGPGEKRFVTEGGDALQVSGTIAAIDRLSASLVCPPIENAHGNLLWRVSLSSPLLLLLERETQVGEQRNLTRFTFQGYSRANGRSIVKKSLPLLDGHLSGAFYDPVSDMLTASLIASKVRFGPTLRKRPSGGGDQEAIPQDNTTN